MGLGAISNTEKILDIGLTMLNGIEAADRIHQIASRSRILFVSEQSDPTW